MKHQLKTSCCLGAIFWMMFAGAVANVSAAEPLADVKAIKQAAEESAKIYLPRAAQRKTDFGFEAQDDVSKAKLGHPIQ
ncbi:MAG TPA: hypothetical protein VNT99_07415, partial [Methylomirabilota bacterium]|nr:hypothetical protein [Methylomirabilota bacterium]